MARPQINLQQSAGGLHCVAVSDVGMRRASNQDSLAIALADSNEHWQSHGHLLLVADGMGAHAAGELASQMATDTIPHSYRKLDAESPSEAIISAVRSANEAIYNKGQNTIDFQGMGTTCSCLLLMPSGALAAHVGDSRVYRLRGEELQQLTFDHSLVWEMAKEGHATEEEVPAYVPKNVITRSLGPHPTVAVDIEGPFPLQTGDRYLLCSDGLTGPLRPELIGMVLSSLPLEDVAQSLVDLANLLGGPDNITVIVTEIVDTSDLGQAELSQAASPNRNNSKKQRSGQSTSWWDKFICAIGLGRNHGGSCTGSSQRQIGLQGKAPYRQHPSTANATTIEPLSDIVRQLEELKDQRQWDVDWKKVQGDHQKAHQAISKGDFPAAVVSYCSVVRQLMHALRNSRPDGPSDSTLEL